MNANELRLSNLVSTIYDPNICFSVTRVSRVAVDLTSANKLITGIGYPSLVPIPLTGELLLKFGFEKCFNRYSLLAVKSNVNFIVLFLDDKFQYDDLRFRTELKYIHQLQNLYFVLANQELEVKQ